ncbi:extracellular solute-binding protein [Phytohabitans sp. ZYX-F-186]|uniref:Extracellular solute-binding protein n=1 Tax=Phytohabitans maris TaxID=3071409 RepID=A0ABU0ZSC5_9ACTN|nr:extracellular solute-binding protein [Phytohabitans sp. ZYX-F-186]MDQ7909930.1 extracellular solute-binding protein [Phytohabitans sp. ZYX-F-186]
MRRTRSGTSARLGTALLAAAVLASACGGGGDDPAGDGGAGAPCALPSGPVTEANNCKYPGQEITVSATPGGLLDGYKAAFGPLFEKTTGARINWVAQGPDVSVTKILAAAGGTPPVDVVLDSFPPVLTSAVENGAFQKIDPASVPNYAEVPPNAFAIEGYGAATWFYRIGQCYDAKKAAALPGGAPKTLDPWFDSDLGVGFPTPENTRWDLTVGTLAKNFGVGFDEPQKAVDRIRQIRGLKLYAASSESDQMLLNGDVGTVVTSDGRCAAMKENGADVAFGSLGLSIDGKSYDYIQSLTGPQIATGSKKVELAKALINTLFTAEALKPLITSLIYDPTQPSVQQIVKNDPKLAPYAWTDFDVLYANTFVDLERNRAAWVDAWRRTFQ